MFGRTWWGKQWLRVLEQLGLTYPDNRLAKARTLVRNGDVDLLHSEAGELSAWVDEPRKSFGVTIQVATFDEAQWKIFDTTVAARLGNIAELADDRLPTAIDKQLAGSGVSLFPTDADLITHCPCRDRSATCVHIIAVQHVFAVELDDDPYLLPLLRGRDREQFIAGIRSARPQVDHLELIDNGLSIDDLPIETYFEAPGSIDAAMR